MACGLCDRLIIDIIQNLTSTAWWHRYSKHRKIFVISIYFYKKYKERKKKRNNKHVIQWLRVRLLSLENWTYYFIEELSNYFHCTNTAATIAVAAALVVLLLFFFFFSQGMTIKLQVRQFVPSPCNSSWSVFKIYNSLKEYTRKF